MPFTLQWEAHASGPESQESLHLFVGTLVITRQADVITDIAWASTNPTTATQSKHPWLDPHSNITLKLLQQGSPYRHRVWAEMCNIPYGETLTYAALAKNIGSAARAVGNACRDNPYPLVIPCHRVVSASGMGGYCGATTGEFMAIKSRLLAYEAQLKTSAYTNNS